MKNTTLNGYSSKLGYQIGLIGFIRTSVLLRLWQRVITVSPRRILRLGGIVIGSLISTPFCLFESLTQGRRISETQINEDPIFIIGHWRSGTTHLHNLMSQDDSLGSLRMFQTLTPNCSITGRNWLAELLQKAMPIKRPMDNMDWPMDAPQEEEIALAKMTPYSWYLSFLFPKQAVSSFKRFVLLENATNKVRREVMANLLRVYRIATLHEKGKRLLLKNPVSTCRIPLLLKLFPNAKFVFIHRCPHEVFNSTLNFHHKILDLTSLQTIDDAHIQHNVIELHKQVTAAYLRDRTKVPKGNLVEVAYTDMINRPMEELKHVYDKLSVQGFKEAKPAIRSYLCGQKNYQKNRFESKPELQELVERE